MALPDDIRAACARVAARARHADERALLVTVDVRLVVEFFNAFDDALDLLGGRAL